MIKDGYDYDVMNDSKQHSQQKLQEITKFCLFVFHDKLRDNNFIESL